METKRQRDKAAAARAQEESEFVRMMEADPDTDDPMLRELLKRRREYMHEQVVEGAGESLVALVRQREERQMAWDEISRRAREEAMLSLDAATCIKAEKLRSSVKRSDLLSAPLLPTGVPVAARAADGLSDEPRSKVLAALAAAGAEVEGQPLVWESVDKEAMHAAVKAAKAGLRKTSTGFRVNK
jgi:hypothetical protein